MIVNVCQCLSGTPFVHHHSMASRPAPQHRWAAQTYCSWQLSVSLPVTERGWGLVAGIALSIAAHLDSACAALPTTVKTVYGRADILSRSDAFLASVRFDHTIHGVRNSASFEIPFTPGRVASKLGCRRENSRYRALVAGWFILWLLWCLNIPPYTTLS
jgi:hypothetical protein